MIAEQLLRWAPDVVALSEFRATPPSLWLAEELARQGLTHQRTSADRRQPAANALLVASRWPLRRLGIRRGPELPLRWLPVRVHAPRPFALGAMHIPNQATGLKGGYHESVMELARHWRSGPAMLVGDTNTGRPGLDEESPVFGPNAEAWMLGLETAGWHDAFRQFHGERREFTWYSPNAGNGFRLDQAFVHRSLLPRVRAVRHEWGSEVGDGASARRDALSDHAALIVDFEG